MFARDEPIDDPDRETLGITSEMETTPTSGPQLSIPLPDLARCFLRLANLPNFALDRLSGYEAVLWRQVSQILFALDALDRRKPEDRGRRSGIGSRYELPAHARDEPRGPTHLRNRRGTRPGNRLRFVKPWGDVAFAFGSALNVGIVTTAARGH